MALLFPLEVPALYITVELRLYGLIVAVFQFKGITQILVYMYMKCQHYFKIRAPIISVNY